MMIRLEKGGWFSFSEAPRDRGAKLKAFSHYSRWELTIEH